ncbi:MAG: phosphoribosylformylglycinamidine cyclo-ligase [Deltaproteobacteria bacterium]|nr:phosphoribosylformylglycinamidine cyclo-ligase [Deltaproteobacteria bacterium]
MAGLTYRAAGVDIDAGERLVDRIKPLAARTRTPLVMGSVGGFAGLCGLPPEMKDPVLVSGTDGVGTKLKLAFRSGVHDSIGIDLVAMCVNDIITCGATPLFFLDYFATGALDVTAGEAVIRGVARGCELAGCALLGGETAEMPGLYSPGEYDLAGFAVGAVERERVLDGSRTSAGDLLVGLASSGLHSNGYSLAQKALFERAGYDLDTRLDDLERPLGAALLEPTRIYARATAAMLEAGEVHALSHITGGGLPGNLPRVLPDGLVARLDRSAWPRSPLFDHVARAGAVAEVEMFRTFNMGLGLVAAVRPEDAAAVRQAAEDAGERAFLVGEIVTGEGPARVDLP